MQKEVCAPVHEGLDTDIFAAAVSSLSPLRVGRYKITKRGLYEYLVNSRTIGLWIAYESSCACAWCLRQIWHECNVALWRYCNCLYLVLTLGELKRGIDHPCFGITRGRLITTFGPMATMLCGFIFEGLTCDPTRNLITVLGGLWSNCNFGTTNNLNRRHFAFAQCQMST